MRISDGLQQPLSGIQQPYDDTRTPLRLRGASHNLPFERAPAMQEAWEHNRVSLEWNNWYLPELCIEKREEDSDSIRLRCCTRWHELPRVAVLTTSAHRMHLPQSYEESELITSLLSGRALFYVIVNINKACVGVLRANRHHMVRFRSIHLTKKVLGIFKLNIWLWHAWST